MYPHRINHNPACVLIMLPEVFNPGTEIPLDLKAFFNLHLLYTERYYFVFEVE